MSLAKLVLLATTRESRQVQYVSPVQQALTLMFLAQEFVSSVHPVSFVRRAATQLHLAIHVQLDFFKERHQVHCVCRVAKASIANSLVLWPARFVPKVTFGVLMI